MEKTKLTGTVLEGYSPVTNFEVCLNEIELKGKLIPSTERSEAVFKVFEEVIPQLGIFQNVLDKVRVELFESVYSHQYTSHKETKSLENIATNKPNERGTQESFHIKRIPYFAIIQEVLDQRNEEAEQLRDDIKVVKENLEDSRKQNSDVILVNETLRSEIDRLQVQLIDRNETIVNKDNEIASLKEEIAHLTDKYTLEKRRLEFEKRRLQEQINKLEKENDFLEQFKQGYDNLHEAFAFQPGDDKFTLGQSRRTRKPVLATRKNHLQTNLQAARKLETQILQVQNQCIEEFDSYMESHKANLQRKVFKEVDDISERFDEESIEIGRIDMELNTQQDRFKQTIESLQGELEMIFQHHNYLANALDEIGKPRDPKPPSRVTFRSNDPSGRSSSVEYGKQSRMSGKDSVLSTGDNFDNLDLLSAEMDPFIPQESILSKYSIMIYTSTNNKKNFHELKDAKFCPSCGEKTVVCPHKVSSEKVVTLPLNCTHIKLSRPRVKIPATRKQREAQAPPSKGLPPIPNILEPPDVDAKRMHSRESMPEEGAEPFHGDSVTPGIMGNQQSPSVDVSQDENHPQHQQNSFLILWDDYKQRTSVERTIPRSLDLKRTLSLMSQFYSYMLWKDEHYSSGDAIHSILDSLYLFMEERYILKDVMYLCIHDLVSSLLEYSAVNKIFTHILVGNLDAATFRYLLVIGDLIDRVDWKFVEDFKTFVSRVYPFLNEDELDQIHLAYTSFSENKISKALVYEYFMYVILKAREPRFQDIEVKLLQRPVRVYGLMNQNEFNESVDALSPLTNEKLRNKLFMESELHFSEDGRVSVVRLAQIAGYLLLSQIAPLLRQKIADDVEDSRVRPGSHKTTSTKSGSLTANRSDDTEDILTMAKLRNLARNISRRNQIRRMRRIEGNLRYDMNEISSDTAVSFYGNDGGRSADGGENISIVIQESMEED